MLGDHCHSQDRASSEHGRCWGREHCAQAGGLQQRCPRRLGQEAGSRALVGDPDWHEDLGIRACGDRAVVNVDLLANPNLYGRGSGSERYRRRCPASGADLRQCDIRLGLPLRWGPASTTMGTPDWRQPQRRLPPRQSAPRRRQSAGASVVSRLYDLSNACEVPAHVPAVAKSKLVAMMVRARGGVGPSTRDRGRRPPGATSIVPIRGER